MAEVLFLAHRVPWPPNRGDKIRSHFLLRKLIEHANVHVICFADDEAEAEMDSPLKSQLASCTIIPRTKPLWLAGVEALAKNKPVSLTSFENQAFRDATSALVAAQDIDCLFVFSGQMAQYIPEAFPGRVVMDFVDVDSAKFDSYGTNESGPMAWVNRREGRLLRAFEDQIAAAVHQSLFVSPAEAKLFQERSAVRGCPVTAVGNGIDYDHYAQDCPRADIANDGPLIVFTGQMDYRPNIEAVLSFVAETMPLVRIDYPNAQFAIVGRAPTAEVLGLQGHNGTIVTGAVDDIRHWLNAADIVVAPLRIARGVQNKVLEAMAAGKPVVASQQAAEGIAAMDGTHFRIADEPSDEARIICDLLDAPDIAERIGRQAQAMVRSDYSWAGKLQDIPALCGLAQRAVLEAAE